MSRQSRGFASYRVSGLPAGRFGETYVVTSAVLGENDAHWMEVFVVSVRNTPSLYHDTFEFVFIDVPEDLLKVDEAYLLSEAKQQAQNYLEELLFQLSEEHGDHILDRYRPELLQKPILDTSWLQDCLREARNSLL